jgi:hypothetical protein
MPTTIELEEDAARVLEPSPPRAAPILSIRASVPKSEAESFIADALHDIRTYLQEHDVSPAGPPFSICRPRGSEVDIEAGWPTARQLAGTRRIHGGALPSSFTRRHRRHGPSQVP